MPFYGRVLGVIFNSDCSWIDHVDFIVRTAKQKTWMLRRLKSKGVPSKSLLELYNLFIRPGLEFAAPLWSCALTKKNRDQIEKNQRQITDIILGKNQLSYSERLRDLNIPSLEERRLSITKAFGEKMMKDTRFQHLFPKHQNNTRSKGKYIIPLCKKSRLKRSSIPKFIEFHNDMSGNRP